MQQLRIFTDISASLNNHINLHEYNSGQWPHALRRKRVASSIRGVWARFPDPADLRFVRNRQFITLSDKSN